MLALRKSFLGKSYFVVALATALLAACMIVSASASATVGGTITPIKTFQDPRGIWPERWGQRHSGHIAIARYGPFAVPAASMTDPGMIRNDFTFNLPAPCQECYITDLVPSLVYANGSNANFETGMMLHHFVLFNPAAEDVTCPNGFFGKYKVGDRFFASGNERSELHLPQHYGYWNEGGKWTLDADLMNMMPEPQQVYVQIVVRYRFQHAGMKSVRPIWLDVNNCATSEYSIPTGYSDTEWSWTSTLNGYIVGIAGHQHDLSAMEMECMDASNCPNHGGGIAISAELVGGPQGVYYGPQPPTGGLPTALTGSTICRSEDHYFTPFGMEDGYMGHLDTMTACGLYSGFSGNESYPPGGAYNGLGFPLQKGQTIRLHSQYTDPGAPHNDVMGIMIAYLHPSEHVVGLHGRSHGRGRRKE